MVRRAGRAGGVGQRGSVRFGGKIRLPQKRFECSRVAPPALQQAVSQRFLLEIHIVDVRDFQFVSPAWPGFPDFFEYCRIVKVDSGNGIAGLWLLRLFFNSENLATGELRATEALRVADFLENDVGSPLLLFKNIFFDDYIIFDDVVAQNDANLLIFHERLRQPKGVRNPTLSLLVAVMDALK